MYVRLPHWHCRIASTSEYESLPNANEIVDYFPDECWYLDDDDDYGNRCGFTNARNARIFGTEHGFIVSIYCKSPLVSAVRDLIEELV